MGLDRGRCAVSGDPVNLVRAPSPWAGGRLGRRHRWAVAVRPRGYHVAGTIFLRLRAPRPALARSDDVQVSPGASSMSTEPLRPAARRPRGRWDSVVLRLPGRKEGARLARRYLVTSVVGTAFSELVLVALYAGGLAGATTAAVIASMLGAVPGYLLSRYWVWPTSARARTARQVASYWAITIASLVAATSATSFASARAPSGHVLRDVIVGGAYVGTYAALWVVKFLILHFGVFTEPPLDARARPVPSGSGSGPV